MKKLILFLLILLMLTGCAAQPTFETVDDLPVSQTAAPAKNLQISLPKNAAAPTMESEDGACFYDCGDYTLTTQIVPSGDLSGTLQQLTGFMTDNLSHMKTKQQNAERYDCVWTAAGEGGDTVCRAVVLDDGVYHYAVTVMADAEKSGQLLDQWKNILSSVSLSTD